VARFRDEAQAIAQMRHPNIVNVYDFGEFDGTPYMIVEYVPGGSLAGKMTQVALDPQAALRYLRGIAAGLDYAHSLGIVHRDVKPANVLLEKDGTPVIADFGLVKLLQGSSLQSMSGVTTGTPAYMAPEQVMGRQVGPASDRYSLATIAYEMLTGAIPFEGEGVLELMYAHVHRDPPPPSSRNAALTRSVDAVIMRGLAKDPQARWESCEAFVTALSASLAGSPAPAVEKTIAFASPLASTVPVAPALSPSSRSAAAATVVEAMPGVATTPVAVPLVAEHRSRRWRWIGAVAGAVILLLVLGLCAIAALKPSISLSANPVHAGDTVVVSGSRLPANQVGEVELFSALRSFPFRADSNGNISVQIVVPRDIHLGDHLVKLCWSNACHVQTTLTVTSPVAVVTATPSPSSSASSTPSSTPTSSPSGTPHPTPSTAPAPSNNPSPIARPTPTPTPPPPPPPSPSPKPIPTPTPAPSLSLVSCSSLGNTVVVFHYFYGGTATVSVWQKALLGTTFVSHQAGTVSVSPGSGTTVTFKTPSGISSVNGPVYVTTTSGLVSNVVNPAL
jgi:eukaryotic-like serine/threonine-protein kinase